MGRETVAALPVCSVEIQVGNVQQSIGGEGEGGGGDGAEGKQGGGEREGHTHCGSDASAMMRSKVP